jgi:hypothetical protein
VRTCVIISEQKAVGGGSSDSGGGQMTSVHEVSVDSVVHLSPVMRTSALHLTELNP